MLIRKCTHSTHGHYMALKNSFFLLLCLLNPFNQLEATIILPELMAKQSIDNIRFLSKEGKFTYYQKRSGSLLFSTNYKVQEILKGEIGTQYTLFSTVSRKKILILQNQNFHNFYSLRSKEKIYLSNYGEPNPIEVGFGIAPNLLLDDAWLSYYDPYLKMLNFEHTTNAALKFSIKLNNKINPYFTPKVVMSDDNTIYYTDLNENGVVGLLEFKRNSGKSEVVYKSTSFMEKLEICLSKDHLILGQFGIHNGNFGSLIASSSLPLKDISKKVILYKSDLNDLGHLTCDDDATSIYFIKNNGSSSTPSFDIMELNPNTKTLSPLTDFKTATTIINMDGTLLTQNKGKYYILKGNADFKNIDSLKQRATQEKTNEKELAKELDDE